VSEGRQFAPEVPFLSVQMPFFLL